MPTHPEGKRPHQLLEEALGISFGEKPPREVELTIFSALALAAEGDEPMLRKVATAYTFFYQAIVGSYIAFYEENRDIVAYTHVLKDVLTSFREMATLHEHLHAWHRRVNPRYGALTKEFYSIIEESLVDGLNSEHLATIEEWICISVVDEGIAVWGSVHAGLSHSDIANKTAFLEEKQSKEGIDQQRADFVHLQNSLIYFRHAADISKPSIKRVQHVKQATLFRDAGTRSVGYGYVDNKVAEFTSQGLTVAEALVKIATNPPLTLKELSVNLGLFS